MLGREPSLEPGEQLVGVTVAPGDDRLHPLEQVVDVVPTGQTRQVVAPDQEVQVELARGHPEEPRGDTHGVERVRRPLAREFLLGD